MICQIGKDLKCKVGHQGCHLEIEIMVTRQQKISHILHSRYGQCEENPEDILNDPNNDGEES